MDYRWSGVIRTSPAPDVGGKLELHSRRTQRGAAAGMIKENRELQRTQIRLPPRSKSIAPRILAKQIHTL